MLNILAKAFAGKLLLLLLIAMPAESDTRSHCYYLQTFMSLYFAFAFSFTTRHLLRTIQTATEHISVWELTIGAPRKICREASIGEDQETELAEQQARGTKCREVRQEFDGATH